MKIIHFFKKLSEKFAEKRLIFMGETPEPTPAPKAEKPADAYDINEEWKKIHDKGEAELTAFLNRAPEAKTDGPRGVATIGEATYTDASGTHKLETDQSDKKSLEDETAEALLKDLNDMDAKTITALESNRPIIDSDTNPATKKSVASMDKDYRESQKPKPKS